MAQKAITIYTPLTDAAHIYAEDDAQINRGIMGGSGITLADGQLECTVTGANTVSMASGVFSNQGYIVLIQGGTALSFTLDYASAGAYRHDLVVADFIRGGGNTADAHTFHIVKGTEAATADGAADPTLIQDDLATGGTQRQEPVWRVIVNGSTVTGVERVARYIGNVYQ